jgi:hypothetical protein
MEKKINFWYLYRKNYYDIEIKKFDKELLGDGSSKFVQLYINDRPVIIAGNDSYHRDLLKIYFKNINLKFNTRLNISKDQIPLEEGENYRLVGAGRVRLLDDKLNFYDSSSDYIAKISGTHKQNLEEIFGPENLDEDEEGRFGPSFFVNI